MPHSQDRHIRNSVIFIKFLLQSIHITFLTFLSLFYINCIPLLLCCSLRYEFYRNIEPTTFFGFASLVCVRDYLHEDLVYFFYWLLTFSALLVYIFPPAHFLSAFYTIVLLKQTLFFSRPSWTLDSSFSLRAFLSF